MSHFKNTTFNACLTLEKPTLKTSKTNSLSSTPPPSSSFGNIHDNTPITKKIEVIVCSQEVLILRNKAISARVQIEAMEKMVEAHSDVLLLSKRAIFFEDIQEKDTLKLFISILEKCVEEKATTLALAFYSEAQFEGDKASTFDWLRLNLSELFPELYLILYAEEASLKKASPAESEKLLSLSYLGV